MTFNIPFEEEQREDVFPRQAQESPEYQQNEAEGIPSASQT